MRVNYLCYVSNKSMMRCPDDVFEIFVEHLNESHPDYLYMSDFNDFYNIKMYFIGVKLVAFTIFILD